VDVGLALPQYDWTRSVGWQATVDYAQRAEQLGFESLWLADHLFLSADRYGGPEGDVFGTDPLVALGALARHTTRARIGTLVLCCQLRPATALAKQLATIDVLSGGRLTIGLGAGWNEREYQVAGIPFHRPGKRLRELADTIDTLKSMFTGAADAPPCRPGPIQQPHPPIWVGGKGDRLLQLVADRADGWNTVWTWTPQQYAERLGVLRQACERAGRDPQTVTLSVGLFTLVGENEADLQKRFDRVVGRGNLDEFRQGHLVGTVEQVRAQVAEWRGLGLSTLICSVGPVPFALTDADHLDMIAAAVA
jgi:probable F420-dependent oxidoreductase